MLREGKVVYQEGHQVRAIRGTIDFDEGFVIVRTTRGEVWIDRAQVQSIKHLTGGE